MKLARACGVLADDPMRRIAAFAWTAVTVVALLVISILILLQPRFPLNFGAIRTTGRMGLLVTLVPSLAAIGGMILWRGSRRRTGAWILTAYSLYWAVVFLSGLPAVWNARRSFCLDALHFCIISPWVARLTVIGIALPFVLAALCWREPLRGVAPDKFRTSAPATPA